MKKREKRERKEKEKSESAGDRRSLSGRYIELEIAVRFLNSKRVANAPVDTTPVRYVTDVRTRRLSISTRDRVEGTSSIETSLSFTSERASEPASSIRRARTRRKKGKICDRDVTAGRSRAFPRSSFRSLDVRVHVHTPVYPRCMRLTFSLPVFPIANT